MNQYATHYRSGETIEVGDRVSWDGREGVVVFIIAQLPEEDWFRQEYGEGFMLDIQGIGWVQEKESDEDLEFIGRKM